MIADRWEGFCLPVLLLEITGRTGRQDYAAYSVRQSCTELDIA